MKLFYTILAALFVTVATARPPVPCPEVVWTKQKVAGGYNIKWDSSDRYKYSVEYSYNRRDWIVFRDLKGKRKSTTVFFPTIPVNTRTVYYRVVQECDYN